MKKRSRESQDNANRRRREYYSLCIELGLTSGEAKVLSRTSEGNIRRLAIQRMSGRSTALLNQLVTRVQEETDRVNRRRKERYALCRSLGFSSYDALKFCGKSVKDIRELAGKRKKKR